MLLLGAFCFYFLCLFTAQSWRSFSGKSLRERSIFDLPKLSPTIDALEQQTQSADFWHNAAQAKKILQELNTLKEKRDTWLGLEKELADLIELHDIAEAEKDHHALEDIAKTLAALEPRVIQASLTLFLSGEYDRSAAILSIHAGTGGVDAQDWGEMLLRMYIRYAERKKYSVTLLHETRGEEAGIKSASILIKGPYAYGMLKEEKGVHRLVRLSPFNAKNSRETSFALVEVVPELEEQADLEIKPEELRIDTFRAGGAGGQNVNKVESAVRITHLPTGLVVACQNERSQMQNRERAMKMLHAKLITLKEQMHLATINELKGEHVQNSWGNQIRSYVLQPYTMVKDHRTNCETSQVHDVLDGDLDLFVEAELLKK